MAGLAAARVLMQAGVAVTVLEGRDRAGGRVWTMRDGFADGEHGELGGEFIDAEQKEIRALCDELHLTLVRVLRGGFTYRLCVPPTARTGCHVSRTRPWEELVALMSPVLQRYRAAGGRADADTVREISVCSLREWLRRQHASPEQHAMADAMRGFFVADPDDLSVLPVVEQIAQGGSPAQTKMLRVGGGSDRIVDALVRGMSARLLLRHRVTAITQSADRVVVTAVDAHGLQQQVEADAVVVALPASTLSGVTITPALPDPQQRAIRTLRYGSATKLLVQMPRDPFRGPARAFATNTALGAFWQGPGKVLTFLGGGSTSRTLRARADEGADAVVADLCWLHDMPSGAEATRAPIHAVTWEDDPFARGGYAYIDPGFDPADRAWLARRADRLVFAGEHTSERWPGYMNGAVETGQRAARELLGRKG